MKTIFKNAQIVNEGKIIIGDVLIHQGVIEKIDGNINAHGEEIDADGKYLIPGIIDDQVHFREPGLTHKADIYSESMAAVAGGVTSFMEMPNTKPPASTSALLEDKYNIANDRSWCNYSFFMGTTNENYEEIKKIDFTQVCGLKIFMGSSTGNMLVDDTNLLDNLFFNINALIATHCEDEYTVTCNNEYYIEQYGQALDASYHPIIRNVEACYLSSSKAVAIANKYNTRLHILHISTAEEIQLFSNLLPLSEKRITSEVCVHHLHFTADDYATKGNLIKCNPAIKESRHAPILWQAMLDNHLDIIATDHAPHTWEEKNQHYLQAPSGLPLVQHCLHLMLSKHHEGKISIERIVEKMCHAPAICFKLKNRGFIREGYMADLVLIESNQPWQVAKDNLYYKCGWSPLEGQEFRDKVIMTMVNGHIVYNNGVHGACGHGQRLVFDLHA